MVTPKIIHVTNDFNRRCEEYENRESEVKFTRGVIVRNAETFDELLRFISEPIVVYQEDDFFLYDKITYKERKVNRYCVNDNPFKLGITYIDAYEFVGYKRVESIRGFLSVNVRKMKISAPIVVPDGSTLGGLKRPTRLISMDSFTYLLKRRRRYIK